MTNRNRGPSRYLRASATRVLAVLLGLSTVPAGVRAQAELQGRVVSDSGRRPVVNAEVAVPRLQLRTLTDTLGRYRLPGIPSGEHMVVTRAVGFRPDSSATVFDGNETLVADVALKPPLPTLDAVNVRAAGGAVSRGLLAGYEERKARGIGHFLDGEIFDGQQRALGDLLGGTIPSLAIQRGKGARAWASSGRATTNAPCGLCRVAKADVLDKYDIASGAPLACYMDVYLDGTQVYSSASRNQMPLFNLNHLDARTIRAVEVYTSTAQIPSQYLRTGAGCGLLMIWTTSAR